MKDKFKEMDPHPISVFSISASMYMAWMINSRSKRPLMSPEETGVPSVRQYLLRLCAEANLKVYRDHAFDETESLLDKCRRITDVEKKHAGYSLLLPLFEETVTDINKELVRIFNEFIQGDIESVYTDEEESEKRQKQLLGVVNDWAYRSQWNTYRACLIRKGIGRSQAAKYKNSENPTGSYNWNEDQGNVTIEDMDDWKERMEEAISTLAKRFDGAITAGCKDIEDCIQTSSLPPKLRAEAIKNWKGCKKKVLDVHPDEHLHHALKVTHLYATTETDVRCMNAKLNADFYGRVYDYDSRTDYRFDTRIDAQKKKMLDVMSARDDDGRLLVERIEEAVIQKSMTELGHAFHKFVAKVMDKIKVFDEYISDNGLLDYKLTDADLQLRKNVLARIPELEAMVADVRAMFNDDELLTQQAVLSTRHTEGGEPAAKKIKVDADD
jgi:hypothetical protein